MKTYLNHLLPGKPIRAAIIALATTIVLTTSMTSGRHRVGRRGYRVGGQPRINDKD